MDGVGFVVRTPQGYLVHSGDFKIDQTPVAGAAMDLNRFAHYGEKGVLALMSDSTNAERPGYTLSESQIGSTLEGLIREAPGRVIVAVFASHIHRMQQIVNIAAKFERRVLFNGKSMVTNSRIAKELGYLEVPPGLEINVGDLDRLPPSQTIVITTGSQGEPLSALARMALEAHKQIHIQKGDLVILSSRFIPGNERAITTVINNLYRLGAEVVYKQVADIHTSGHASQEELKLLLSLTRPRYFIPIHGELRHLIKHGHLARAVGIPEERVLLATDGNQVRFEAGEGAIAENKADTGRVFVDGKGVGDVSRIVLRDRRHLAADGLVIAYVAVDPGARRIVTEPETHHPGLHPGRGTGPLAGTGPQGLPGDRPPGPERTHPGLAGDPDPGVQGPAQALLQTLGAPAHDFAVDPDAVMHWWHRLPACALGPCPPICDGHGPPYNPDFRNP